MVATKQISHVFSTDRLVLRAVELSDGDKAFMHELLSDPVLVANTTLRPQRPPTLEAAEEFVKLLHTALVNVMVCLPAEAQDAKPTPIGYMAIFYTASGEVHRHRNAMLGLALAEPYRGKGYGTEIIEWGIDWAFRCAGLHRLSICAFSYNTGAVKLYRRLGFVDEGVERQSVYRNRAWHDTIFLSLLEHEWDELRQKQDA